MKTNSTLIRFAALSVMALLAMGSFAQQLTSPMQLIINGPAPVSGELTYGYAIDYGPTTMSTVTADLAWAYDITPDSLACDSVPAGSLTGKIALVRRGACQFAQKVYYAQVAGAIGCIIVNNSGTSEIQNMAGGTLGPNVTIPSAMISFNDGQMIADAMNAGNTVNASFYVGTVHGSSISYAHGTPLSRVVPHEDMKTNVYNNTGSIQSNVSVTLDITDPMGGVTNFTTQISSLADGADTTAVFSGSYTPSMLGTYQGVIKSSLSAVDSVVHTFEITDDLMSLDNGDLANAKGFGSLTFTGDYTHHRGAVYPAVPMAFSGDSITATFALENADQYVGETFTYVLYTPNDSISPNFQNETDYSTFITRGVATRVITTADAAAPNLLLTETLKDPVSGNNLTSLLPNIDYMLVVKYEGTGTIMNSPRFTYTHKEDYLKLDQVEYSSGQLNLGGWSYDMAPVMRLNLYDCASAIDTTVSYNGTDLTAQATGAQYQWIDCNNGNAPISGATGQTFTPTVNSTYAVEITVNGCTATSNCIMTTLGLNDVASQQISVFPNPTNGLVTVSSKMAGQIQFTLTEMDGRIVQQGTADGGLFTVDASALNAGMYLLHIDQKSERQSVRIIKR